METVVSINTRITGLLLVAGAIIFFIGASIPFLTGLGGLWTGEMGEQLTLIGANRTVWIAANGLFVVAAVLTIAGLAQFSTILQDAGERLFANPALLIFTAGAILWMAALALRLSVSLWAADTVTATATPPAAFEPIDRWGEMLLNMYMFLAYVAIAVYGIGLLQTAAFPAWLGWTSLVVGIVAALSLVTGFPLFIFLIPAGTYIMPLVIGIELLVWAGQTSLFSQP